MLIDTTPVLTSKLLFITGAALIAPIIAHLIKYPRVPALVVEIILGVIIGPQVLNWVNLNLQLVAIAHLGLTFLIFLAGYEVQIKRIWGRPLKLAGISWFMSLLLALGLAYFLFEIDIASNILLLGLCLTTTALGVLLPVLHDSKMSKSEFSTFVLSVGTFGEFGPILVMTLLLTASNPGITTLFLICFVGITIIAALIARGTRQPKLVQFVRQHLGASSQITVRISVFLLIFLVFLTIHLGLNSLMGAFAAGIVVRLFTMETDVKIVESKLKAIGFGFLIPIFFLVSGISFDLDALFSREALVRVPILLMFLLLIRGLPIFFTYRNVMNSAERCALTLYSAIGLPLIVVITHIGVHTGKMLSSNAAYILAAGVLSVLIFPSLGTHQLNKQNVKNISN